MKPLLFLLCLWGSVCSLQAQVSQKNMTLLNKWKPDSIQFDQYNDIWGYTDCNGREYAILGSAARVHFVDITIPTEPREVASFAGGGVTTWRDMKTYRDRAYAVSESFGEGLMIFDLSQLPDTVLLTNQTDLFFQTTHNIFIDNGKLYAAGTNTANNGLVVLDLQNNPDEPELLASVSLAGGYVHDLFVREDTAYCSHGWDGLYIWDFKDPENPVALASVNTGQYNHSNWILEGSQYLLFAEEVPTGQPLGILDISNLAAGDINEELTFTFPLLAPDHIDNTPHNPFIRGQYAIVSYYEDGVQIFDLSDPLNPQQVAWYDTYQNSSYNGYNGCWGVYPFFPSGIIIGSDISNGLFVLQADSIEWAPLTYPSTPTLSANLEASSICPGDSVRLTVSSQPADLPVLIEGPDPLGFETTDSINLTVAGTYTLQVFNEHCPVSDTLSFSKFVPTPPSVTISMDTRELIAEGGISYQWFLNGMPIDTAQDDTLQIERTGDYLVEIVDSNGCTSQSQIFPIVILSNSQIWVEGDEVKLYPNPAQDILRIQLPDRLGTTSIQTQIFDVHGRQVLQTQNTMDGQIEVSNLPSGMYFLKLLSKDRPLFTGKFVKQ